MSNGTWKSLVVLLLCLVCAAAVCPAPALAADEGALSRADSAFSAGDYKTAKALYEQFFAERGAINDTPEERAANARVLLQLGHCCRLMTDLVGAKQWFAKVMATYPADRASCAQALFWLGNISSLRQLFPAAAASLQQLLRDYPEESKAYPETRLLLA